MASSAATGPAPANSLSGSRVNFMIQGVVMGFAQNLSYSHNYSLQPINVVGSLETVQHVPTLYSASITFNNFVVLGQTLRTLGLWPRIGKTPQEHMRNLIAIPEVTAVCEDVVTNTIILVAEGVRIESNAVQAAANQLLSGDVSAVCRRLYIEGDAI